MAQLPQDPYAVLGVRANATDAEIRAAYRRAVQRHHPDHNNGSPESTRKFEEVQDAYARIRRVREGSGAGPGAGATGSTGARARTGSTGARAGTGSDGTRAGTGSGPGSPSGAPGAERPSDPAVEARLAQLERELREAQRAREQAEKEAREARARARRAAEEAEAAAASARAKLRDAGDPRDPQRPTDEELGYVHTDDSFSKIIADAREQLGGRVSDVREGPVGQRISDLIDELEGLADRLTGDDQKRRPR